MIKNKIKNLLFPNTLIIRILIPFTIIAVASRSFIYIDKLSYFVPAAFIYLIITTVSEKENRSLFFKNSLFYLPFGLWAALTSAWSSYPVVSLSRSLYFLLMSSAVVSIIVLIKKYKLNLFSLLLPLNLFIVIISLVSLILGYPHSAWTGGNAQGFMGFAAHQNTLGALLLFTIPASVYFFITKSKHRIYFSVLILINTALLISTHSRASMLALVIFIMTTAYLDLNSKTFLLSAALTVIFTTALFFNTHTSTFTKQFLVKQQNNFGDSRYFLFDASYEAAVKNPLSGLGFGISDPQIQIAAAGSHFENGRYIREKGNSTLAIVEEIGLIGLLLFLMPSVFLLYRNKYVLLKKNLLNSCNKIATILLLSSLFSYFVHSQFEAWMPGVTSFNLFLFLTFTIFLLVTIESE